LAPELQILALPAAFTLDLVLGDPPGWPHPVRWMGRAIENLEPRFRRRFGRLEIAGMFFALFLVLMTWTLAVFGLKTLQALHPLLGFGGECLLLYYCLATRDLCDAGMHVFAALRREGLQAARNAVGRIVGRDVAGLDAGGVSRAAVESVAENLVDGVIAPIFYAALGGAPLALAYKMVNTLDSMVGYRNARYLLFGRASARLDDVLNWVPARLAVPLTALGAALMGGEGRRALRTAWREGHRHTSPNAGFGEAAFAGALGVRLGGPSCYGGQTVHKPWLGASFDEARPDDIPRACSLMVITAVLALVLLWGAGALTAQFLR